MLRAQGYHGSIHIAIWGNKFEGLGGLRVGTKHEARSTKYSCGSPYVIDPACWVYWRRSFGPAAVSLLVQAAIN